jgi:hypothetical protein
MADPCPRGEGQEGRQQGNEAELIANAQHETGETGSVPGSPPATCPP